MKINSSKIRSQYNLFRVLRSIWLNHGISRIELCKLHDMDKATMSSIVGHLINLQVVEEVEPHVVEVKPGRKPIGLGIVADFAYVAGMEYHKSGIRAVIKNMHSLTVYESDFPFDIKSGDIKKRFLTVYEKIKEELEGKRLLGIGVAVPGIVNHEQGIILSSRKMGLEDEPYDFRKEIFDHLDVPGFIDNDANCCARGILADHRTGGYSNFLYTHINYETDAQQNLSDDSLGLGFGIVLKEKVYYGPDFTAGEFQTIEYNPDRINQLNLTNDELERYGRDEELQRRVFHQIATHFALFINVFNFSHLFLGGDLPSLIPDLETVVRDVIDKNWLYKNAREIGIHILGNKDMSPALGAAGMFLEQLFTVPEMDHSRGALIWQDVFGESLIDY